MEELNKFNLLKQEKEAQPQPIFVSASLSADLKQTLFGLSRELNDLFVWTYAEMHGLDPRLITHQLNTKKELG